MPPGQKLQYMSEEQVDDALEFILNRLNDNRMPPKMRLWAIVERCKQIDGD